MWRKVGCGPFYDGVAEIDLHVMWHQDARFSDAETIFMEFFLNALGKVPLEERLTTGLELFDETPDVNHPL